MTAKQQDETDRPADSTDEVLSGTPSGAEKEQDTRHPVGEDSPETKDEAVDAEINGAEVPTRDGPDTSTEEDEDLAVALLEAQEQVQSLNDRFLRVQAEMQNVSKRSQNEIQKARKYAIEEFARELLSVKDSLDQATQVELDMATEEAITKMKEGVVLTLKQLQTVLSKFSVVEIEAGPGVKFNPDLHQAVTMIKSDDIPSNHIISVMQRGFVLNDRLLRPAMVVVAS